MIKNESAFKRRLKDLTSLLEQINVSVDRINEELEGLDLSPQEIMEYYLTLNPFTAETPRGLQNFLDRQTQKLRYLGAQQAIILQLTYYTSLLNET